MFDSLYERQKFNLIFHFLLFCFLFHREFHFFSLDDRDTDIIIPGIIFTVLFGQDFQYFTVLFFCKINRAQLDQALPRLNN